MWKIAFVQVEILIKYLQFLVAATSQLSDLVAPPPCLLTMHPPQLPPIAWHKLSRLVVYPQSSPLPRPPTLPAQHVGVPAKLYMLELRRLHGYRWWSRLALSRWPRLRRLPASAHLGAAVLRALFLVRRRSVTLWSHLTSAWSTMTPLIPVMALLRPNMQTFFFTLCVVTLIVVWSWSLCHMHAMVRETVLRVPGFSVASLLRLCGVWRRSLLEGNCRP